MLVAGPPARSVCHCISVDYEKCGSFSPVLSLCNIFFDGSKSATVTRSKLFMLVAGPPARSVCHCISVDYEKCGSFSPVLSLCKSFVMVVTSNTPWLVVVWIV